MTLRLQIFSIVLLLVVLVLLFRQVHKKKIELRYVLPWIVLVIGMLVLVVFPIILYSLTDLLGILTPSNMLLFCGLVLALMIIYGLSVAVSKMTDNLRAMAQKIAMLEERLKEIKKNESAESEVSENTYE